MQTLFALVSAFLLSLALAAIPVGASSRGNARIRAGRVYWAFTVLGPLVVTLRYVLDRGQDFSFDQLNYHISVPWMVSHGTYWTSIAPIGIQGYFDPLLHRIELAGMLHLSPKVFAILLALVQSLAFMMAAPLCRAIAGPGADARPVMAALSGYALCLLAPVALSEGGTTLVELPTAVLVLGAYALLLQRGVRIGHVWSGALAGGLIGAAVALKLTNAVFAFGVAGFALAGRDPLRRRLPWLMACGAAMIAAFLAVGGIWCYELWVRFANPFFPYYNGLFRSPDFPPVSIHDTRFLPHSVLDIWRYPLYWLLGGSPRRDIGSPSAELGFRDARWVIAIFGGTVFLASLVVFRRWARETLKEPATGLFFAFCISYLIWLTIFGYSRYAVPLDILCGAIILVLAQAIRPERLKLGLLFLTVALSWWMMTVPDWGHVPWKSHFQSIAAEPIKTGGPTIVFLTVKPSSFIAASLPADTRYVGIYGDFNPFGPDGDFDLAIGNDTSLTRQLRQELASKTVNLKEVDFGAVPEASRSVLAGYGLVATDECQVLHMGNKAMRLCDVRREK